jgi:hypothetical protein
MGMAYTAVVCNRCNADIPAESARENENWCSPQCEPVQMRELRRQRDTLRAALVQAREDMREWAGYVDEYYLKKWDFAGDLAAIDAALEASK